MKANLLKKMISAALAAVIMIPCIPSFGTEDDVYTLYVSPSGSDNTAGGENDPFGSIETACLKASKLVSEKNKPVDIVIKNGVYRLTSSVSIGAGSSGKDGAPVTIKAESKGGVVFTRAKKLPSDKFVKVTDKAVLNRMPAEAAGNVYMMKLSDAGITNYGSIERVERHKIQTPSSTLFIVDDKMMTLAEWPNKAFTSIKNVTSISGGYEFAIDEDRINRWTTATELYAYGNFSADWADETFKLKNLNVKNRSFQTTYTTVHGVSNGGQVRFINLLEELDIPGEWFLDRTNGTVYYYPFVSPAESDIELVITQKELFNLSGTENVVIDGLTFEGTCGPAVVIDNANKNTIQNCEFKNIGQQAVIIKNSRENLIDKNEMHDIGKGCVHISGGDRENLILGNNRITNNHMERFAVIGRRYCDAVQMRGIGDVLSHNRIHNSPHEAVDFSSPLNTIEYNDIYDVVEETGDAGAVYAGRSWTNGGNVIRYNFIHDCRKAEDSGRAAIYCDDYMTDVDMYGNIFANLNTGITLHSSMLCTVRNNLFIDIATSAAFLYNIDLRSDESVRQDTAKALEIYNNGTLRDKYKSTVYSKAVGLYDSYYKYYKPDSDIYNEYFPYLRDMTKNPYVLSPRDDVIENNAVYGGGRINITSGEAKKTGSFDNNYETDDAAPVVDAAHGNYNIADESKINEYFDFNAYDNFCLPKIEETGIIGEESAELKDFNLIAPVNGAENVQASDVVLCWEDTSGADKYRLIVARDADFTDIVCDEITNFTYKRFRNLKYGQMKYYWRVEAIASSYLYGDNNSRQNSNGIYTFTTAQREEVNKSELKEVIDTAAENISGSVEGDKPGELRIGSRDILKQQLYAANKVYDSENSSKKKVERTAQSLSEAITVFECSRNAEELNFGALAADTMSWNGNAKASGGGMAFESDGSGGYNGDLLKAHNVLSMTAEFSINDIGYTSVGLRSGNNSTTPWSTTEYIFLVKKDTVELQRFNGSNRFFFDKPNTMIKNDIPVQLKFGAVTEENGIRITVEVNGEEVFNYLDEDEFAVAKPGKFHVYNNSGAGVRLSAAK